MAPVNVKDLAPSNRAMRARRLRQLKKSVENHSYRINSSRLANDMIREVCSNEAAKKLSHRAR